MMSGLRIVVRGRVQGVGYRAYVARQTAALGITGHVRNLHQRDEVEIVACGDSQVLDLLIDQLRTGPVGAMVTGVSAEIIDTDVPIQDFTIRY